MHASAFSRVNLTPDHRPADINLAQYMVYASWTMQVPLSEVKRLSKYSSPRQSHVMA